MKKYCPRCNAVFTEEMKFCVRCGEALVAQNEQKRKDRGMVKLVLILLLLCVGGGTTFWAVNYFSAEQKVLRMLEAGNYEEAQAIYFENIAGNEEAEKSISESLKQRLSQIKNDYIEGEIDYDTAIEKLSVIRAMEEDSSSYGEAEQYITDLKKSRDAYQSAESFLAMEDYVEAIRQYELVADIDSNYEDAQSKLVSCREVYKENILSKAEAYAAENDFYDAVVVLNYALEILTNDNDLQILIVKYQKDEVLASFNEYESKSDWDGLMKYGLSQSSLIGSDPDLASVFNSLYLQYCSAAIQESDNILLEKGYVEAINYLKDRLEILPEEEKFLEKIEEYKRYIPVEFYSLNVIGSDDLNLFGDRYYEKTCTNIYGDEYYGYYDLCSYRGKEAYVEVYTDCQYQYFGGTFFTRSAMDESFTIAFQVYADDVLVYDSGYINRRTKPIDFEIDIHNAEIVKILSTSTDYTFYNTNPGIILTNTYVYNKPIESDQILDNNPG